MDEVMLGGYPQVSIHASVKDATPFIAFVGSSIRVSIHASVKDATFRSGSHYHMLLFQSTRP